MATSKAASNALSPLKGVYMLSALISIILFAYIATYLVKLEKTGCKCAQDWRRSYILAYMVFMIFHASLSLFTFGYANKSSNVAIALHRITTPISVVLGILFIIFTFQYVHRLEREKCECSQDLGRAIMLLVAAIDAAVFAVIGLFILLSIISFAWKS